MCHNAHEFSGCAASVRRRGPSMRRREHSASVSQGIAQQKKRRGAHRGSRAGRRHTSSNKRPASCAQPCCPTRTPVTTPTPQQQTLLIRGAVGHQTQAAAAALLRQLRRVDTRQVDTSAVQKASALAGRSSDRLCPAILTESPRLDLAATLLTEAQGCLLRHVWLGGWCRWWWDLHMMYACMCLVSGRDVTYAYM